VGSGQNRDLDPTVTSILDIQPLFVLINSAHLQSIAFQIPPATNIGTDTLPTLFNTIHWQSPFTLPVSFDPAGKAALALRGPSDKVFAILNV
jgi:hypothetical protein